MYLPQEFYIFTKDLSKDHPYYSFNKKAFKSSDIISYNRNGLFNNIIDTLKFIK